MSIDVVPEHAPLEPDRTLMLDPADRSHAGLYDSPPPLSGTPNGPSVLAQDRNTPAGKVDGYFRVIESKAATTPERQMNGGLEKARTAATPSAIYESRTKHPLTIPQVTPNTSPRLRSNTSSTSPVVTDHDGPRSAAATVPSSPSLRRSVSLTLLRYTSRSINSDIHTIPDDAISPSDNAVRWVESIRAKRASKRRRREEEEDDRVLVGTKIGPDHCNYSTMYNMLTGIRVGVSRCNAKVDRELTHADFDAKHKFSFDIVGSELTPSAKYDFKFKDYAPWVFRHLRQMFHLDPADYLISLTSKYILSELTSPGKSGSFFYFSRDYRFIIKTISQREHKFLRSILKDYYRHVESNPNTLISQYYGLHRVKEPYGRKLHFVVMNNLFPPNRDIHQTYDLKGSTQGRTLREEDLLGNPRATLKDLNWLRRDMSIHLGPKKAEAFKLQLEADVMMLQRLNIMDYSLLLGIHDLQRGNTENIRDATLSMFQPEPEIKPLSRTPSKLEQSRKARELRRKITRVGPTALDESTLPREHSERKNFIFYGDDGGFKATDENDRPGNVIYYLGLIDCLTCYSRRKHLETFVKSLKHSRQTISAIPPKEYGDRFLKFIMEQISSNREAKEKKGKENRSVEDAPRRNGEKED